MKVLFTGGGTAGHINPALAAAGYLQKKEPDVEILYVGNKGGMEERLVPQAGYEIRTVHISGFQRKLTPKNLVRNAQTVVRMFTATEESKKILKEFAPDVCVGTGGYVSGPVIREAAKLGIPCVVHESNAYPGVTIRMLAKYVKTVMLAVPDAKNTLTPPSTAWSPAIRCAEKCWLPNRRPLGRSWAWTTGRWCCLWRKPGSLCPE